MTSQHEKSKRFRLCFSVRTLVVVVTLVCCYATCWGPTKRQGAKDVSSLLSWAYDGVAIAPLFVETETMMDTPTTIESRFSAHKYYYFWFFGFVAKLPYAHEVDFEDYVRTHPAEFPGYVQFKERVPRRTNMDSLADPPSTTPLLLRRSSRWRISSYSMSSLSTVSRIQTVRRLSGT